MRQFTGICVCALLGFWVHAAAAAPCEGVDRHIDAAQAQAPEIARQINDHTNAQTAALPTVQTVQVLSALRVGGWSVLYVDTGVADDAYLFYSASPAQQHFLALWAGSAEPGDEPSIKAWEVKTMPWIPDKLAACFAWHVIYEGG